MTRAYQEILDAEYESSAHAETVNEHLKWLNRLEFNDWVPPALAFATDTGKSLTQWPPSSAILNDSRTRS